MTIHCADCRAVLPTFEADSLDACVTDPPYGREFMGKDWDHGIPGVAFWLDVKRVLKPGAHLLAFGGTRTHHRLMCAIEDAGFEIRDTTLELGGEIQMLAWIYGTGFPKSLDVSRAIDKAAGAERATVGRKSAGHGNQRGDGFRHAGGEDGLPVTVPATDAARQWDGWGTALKPAWEPIIVARKPFTGTVAANVLEHGTGALNIDGCRVETDGRPHRVIDPKPEASGPVYAGRQEYGGGFDGGSKAVGITTEGRWPANVVLDEEAAAMLDAQSGERPGPWGECTRQNPAQGFLAGNTRDGAAYRDTGGAARFFYTAKASRRERDYGLEGMEPTRRTDGRTKDIKNPRLCTLSARNDHPTVKPVALMRWLVRLVTPPGGTVLDPFMGSGSTKLACEAERLGFVGIDLDEHYCEIARHRKLLLEVLAGAAQMGMVMVPTVSGKR